MGADLSRGILNFAEGKKLGQTGLKWLKIHTANLIGFDKARLPDKIEAIEKNLPMLKAIAENPKKNQQWL
jgi:DNA-directed RNA polymerase